MKYTHLIWDFNGTVLDDVAVGLASANSLLCSHGLQPMPSVEYYRSVFRFPIREYYRKLGFDFDKTPFEKLAPEWVEKYMARVGDAGLNEGVIETLAEVRRRGICQILLSATETEMLHGQLAMLGLQGAFDGVFGLDNIHAVSKRERATAWCAQNPEARVLFLGDTDHDAEVASAVGRDCVLFAGGHQSKNHLLGLGYPVIDHISDILPYFSL